MSRVDVAVVGSGPSGSVAATLIARAGRSVAVIDPGRAGHRVGETLPGAGARLLRKIEMPGPMDGTEFRTHRPIRGVISAWDGVPVIEDFMGQPDGGGWRLDRLAFDRGLEDAARRAGAERIWANVLGLRRDADHWKIETDRGPISAEFVVDASGRRAAVSRLLGVPRVRETGQVAVYAVGGEMPLGAAGTDRTLIEAHALGWWYGAMLPDRRPLAILHCAPDVAHRLRRSPQIWHDALRSGPVLANHLPVGLLQDADPQFCDASGAYTHPVGGRGWIACGDAAMAFDPLASQGLFNALRSAQAAAEVALAPDPEAAAQRYGSEMSTAWQIYATRRAAHYARLQNAPKSGVKG